jgi:hypothetical protein
MKNLFILALSICSASALLACDGGCDDKNKKKCSEVVNEEETNTVNEQPTQSFCTETGCTHKKN